MATDAQIRFHQEWLGLAQPYEGLVFSVPVLADAQIAPQVGADLTARFRRALVQPEGQESGHIGDLPSFFEDFLGYTQRGALLRRESLPEELHLYAQEGRQNIRPSFAIARSLPEGSDDLFAGFGDEPKPLAPSSDGQSPYIALVWDVRDDAGQEALGLDLDKPEELTGPWRYPPTAKFERLLRAAGIQVGFLSNGRDIRLIFAPAGETTSHLTFRGEFMQRPDGRPILAAFELLLNANRTYRSAPEFTFEGLLKESRSRQADVTKELASQVFEAVEILLTGFEVAGNRDSASGRVDYLRPALEEPHDHAYQGVLSVILRLVFLLYAEDQSLLPVQHEIYANHLSVKGLYDELVEDAGQHPESMNHRFGAYGRLLALFRAVFLGVEHRDLKLPPRRGRLFDPNSYPFLEGGLPGTTAAVVRSEERASTLPPSIDDGTVYEVLHRLIFFQGQRLSYASLDVEQLGSVYESLMGYHVLRVAEPAVRLGKNWLWLELHDLRHAKAIDRQKLLKESAGLSAQQVTRVDDLLKAHKDNGKLAEELNELSPGGKKERHRHRALPGRLVLQPGEERRRSGSHYTPRSLTEGIVRRTLEPLLKCLGEEPTEDQILSLKICDPAMGSGAFLVEVVRQLAKKLEEVWSREKRFAELSDKYGNANLHARRLVAQQCVYGVDKNAAAVELAKLSLWLVTLSADLPFTFLDHALRHGDSLVGLSLDQISSFHWTPEKQVPLFHKVMKECLDEALDHRAELLSLAKDETPRSQDERRRLLDHAEQATNRIRMVADLCVGAFFAEEKDKDRNAERVRRLDLVDRWLKGETKLEPELQDLAGATRERLAPFHWMIEFPEVFYQERPDPLDGGKVNGAAMMEGFVGNPPFMGKNSISVSNGKSYLDWFMTTRPEVAGHPNTDLCAYFFRRAHDLLGSHGTVGLVATNTIAQGDTRFMALQRLVQKGARIYAARSGFPWPGAAAVTVTTVHMGFGKPSTITSSCCLDDQEVAIINSRLLPHPERGDPITLNNNRGCAYMGGKLVGVGLAVDPQEHAELVARNPHNCEVLRPYIGGEDVNTSPTQAFGRWVIDFTNMTLDEASQWPDLIRIVETRVRPAREKDKRGTYKTYWWRPGESGGALREMLGDLGTCLVTARVTKHLCFSFQPTNQFFNEKLYVFPFDRNTQFSILQSRLHCCWTWMLSSTMKTDLNYSASDCFETFPFPEPDPRTVIPELEAIGEKLYEVRAQYMVDTDQGLTKTYNALKDPACTDERIIELRRLHEEMDRAVLRAYPKLPGVGPQDPSVVGWSDIEVPPFCIATEADQAALQAFEDEVIDRLFVLNEIRAKAEAAYSKPAKMGSVKENESPNMGAAPKKAGARGKKGNPGQGRLF